MAASIEYCRQLIETTGSKQNILEKASTIDRECSKTIRIIIVSAFGGMGDRFDLIIPRGKTANIPTGSSRFR